MSEKGPSKLAGTLAVTQRLSDGGVGGALPYGKREYQNAFDNQGFCEGEVSWLVCGL